MNEYFDGFFLGENGLRGLKMAVFGRSQDIEFIY